jgi:bifunctional non-homologous end joining protein LigD
MSRSRPPAALPELVSPTSAAKPPSGPGWIEIKYDGYRIMAQRAQGGTRLFTRNGHDWSTRCPLVVAAVEALWALS